MTFKSVPLSVFHLKSPLKRPVKLNVLCFKMLQIRGRILSPFQIQEPKNNRIFFYRSEFIHMSQVSIHLKYVAFTAVNSLYSNDFLYISSPYNHPPVIRIVAFLIVEWQLVFLKAIFKTQTKILKISPNKSSSCPIYSEHNFSTKKASSQHHFEQRDMFLYPHR